MRDRVGVGIQRRCLALGPSGHRGDAVGLDLVHAASGTLGFEITDEGVEGHIITDVGYSDQQIVEALLVMGAVTFTNHLNRVNDTPIDFPRPST